MENKTAEVREDERYYKLTDVMKILHVGRNTAYKLVKQEGFPKLLVCGKYLIPKREFEEWCVSHQTTTKL